MITVLIFFGFVACEIEFCRGAVWPVFAFATIGTLGGQDALAMYSAGLIAVGLAEIGIWIVNFIRSRSSTCNYA